MNFNFCSLTAAAAHSRCRRLMFGGRKSRKKSRAQFRRGGWTRHGLSRSSVDKRVVECKMNANTTCNWSVDIIFMPFRMVDGVFEHTKNVKLLFFKPFSSFLRIVREIYIKVHSNVRHNYHKWHRACLRCENNNSIFPSTPERISLGRRWRDMCRVVERRKNQ